ncbi:MAG: PQQ-binding-like beta-propeller repeat protein [Planctomycetaceae bacterium]
MRLLIAAAVVSGPASAALQAAQPGAGDWPWWRGPDFNNVAAAGEQPPLEWGETRNIVWKVPVPGRGHSSPTVVGEHIYLATADESRQVQGVICLSRATGEQLWITPLSEGGFPATHPKNTHATCTVACDGERLFVTFHHHNKLTLHCLDRQGGELWAKEVGHYEPKKYEYGYAASPLIYKDTVIVVADYEQGGYLAAYDRANGQQRWRTDRPKSYSFSSPVVANVGGREQLLLSGCDAVTAYDPASGKPLWSTPGTTMATCGTMIWDGDRVFASGGYPKAETICVQAGGTHSVVWKNGVKCYEQSMLIHDGHVYAFDDQGVAYCWRASDGAEQWKRRLGGAVSTSPLLVGDSIIAINEKGTAFVFKASPEGYVAVATNQLGDEGFATPAVGGDRIYLRTATGDGPSRQEFLYCIGTK